MLFSGWASAWREQASRAARTSRFHANTSPAPAGPVGCVLWSPHCDVGDRYASQKRRAFCCPGPRRLSAIRLGPPKICPTLPFHLPKDSGSRRTGGDMRSAAAPWALTYVRMGVGTVVTRRIRITYRCNSTIPRVNMPAWIMIDDERMVQWPRRGHAGDLATRVAARSNVAPRRGSIRAPTHTTSRRRRGATVPHFDPVRRDTYVVSHERAEALRNGRK